MTSYYDNDREQVFEHEDVWELQLNQLMTEAAQFQQQSDCLHAASGPQQHSYEQLQHLLDKKDEALMLAARIGQTLLTKINTLASRNKELELQTAEQIDQLKFDKSQLHHQLQLHTSYGVDEVDEADYSHDGATSYRRQSSCSTGSCCEQLELLRSRLTQLEQDNDLLNSKVNQLTIELEGQSAVQTKNARLELELHHANDKLSRKQRIIEQNEEQLNKVKMEIVFLAGQLVQMENEMEKLQSRLECSLQCNTALQSKYDDAVRQSEEYMSLYNTLRAQTGGRRRTRRITVSRESSIAQELDNTLETHTTPSTENMQRRLFETMKLLNMTVQCPRRQCAVSASIQCRVVSHCQCNSPSSTAVVSHNYWRNTARMLGQPGRPGSSDLRNSLLRLQWLADKSRRLPSLLPPSSTDINQPTQQCAQCQQSTHSEPADSLAAHNNKLELVKVMEGKTQVGLTSNEANSVYSDLGCFTTGSNSQHHIWEHCLTYVAASGFEVAMTFWALHRAIRNLAN